jgi:hypothetical protein
MYLQAFLRNGGGFDYLKGSLGLHIKTHKDYPDLHLFKYDPIGSPMGDPIVRESRGVILDQSQNWDVVCRPFDKFFNYGEGHAATIDWDTAHVQEKVDGSLMTLYWYNGVWHVSSSGTPDASGPINGTNTPFSDLFWETFSQKCGYRPPTDQLRQYNFMFELCTPLNRVVVRHTSPFLVLLGVRDRLSGVEMRPDQSTFQHLAKICPDIAKYRAVRSFPLQTIDDVTATFQQMDPVIQEGYVIVDDAFNRVKVKHPGYVAIHHLRGEQGPTRKGLLAIIRSGEKSEILTYFPEWTDLWNEVEQAYRTLITELEADYSRINAEVQSIIPAGVIVQPSWTQKEFAMRAIKARCSDALFRLRAGKETSIQSYLTEMDLNKLSSLLKFKN